MGGRAKRLRPFAVPAEIAADTPPPATLSRDGERRAWRQLLPVLVAGGVVTPADLLVFAEYCKTVSRRDEIEEKMGADWWATTAGGGVKGHPGMALLARCEMRIDRLAQQLGFNPGARLTIKAKEQATQGELDFPAPVRATQPAGKKEQAAQESLTAGKATGWGDDLAFRGMAH
jgi:P27 family predicted phage terminase small subunit